MSSSPTTRASFLREFDDGIGRLLHYVLQSLQARLVATKDLHDVIADRDPRSPVFFIFVDDRLRIATIQDFIFFRSLLPRDHLHFRFVLLTKISYSFGC